jgi:hypothetical protein
MKLPILMTLDSAAMNYVPIHVYHPWFLQTYVSYFLQQSY